MKLSQKKGGVILSYLSMASNVIVKFLYTPLLLRLLGQSEYGLYSLVISIVGYLAILEFGFGSTVTRYVIKYKSNNDLDGLKKVYGTLSLVYIIIGIIALLVCICLALLSDSLFSVSMTTNEVNKVKLMILLCGVNLFFSFPLQISTAVLTAYEKFIFKNGVNMLKILLEPIVVVLLLYFVSIDSVGTVLTITLFNLFGLVAYYIYAVLKLDFKFNLAFFNLSLLRQLLSFSTAMFLLSVFEQIQFNSGQFILGIYYGSETIAVWGVAMIFVLNYRSLSTAITNVFIPSFLSANFGKDTNSVNTMIIKMTRIQCFVLLTILCNFILFGENFIIFWAGSNYSSAFSAALIIMVPMTISLLLEFCYLSQMATKNLSYRVITLFISFVIAYIFISLITDINIISFALIIALSIILGQIFFVSLYIINRMNINFFLVIKNVFQISVAPLALLSIYYILNKIILGNTFSISWFCFSILLFNTFLFLIYWLFSMTKEDKNMIKVVK